MILRLVTSGGQTPSITSWSAPGTLDPLVQSYPGSYAKGLGVVSKPNESQLAVADAGPTSSRRCASRAGRPR
jgi:hypothetical protein